jgi:hypothetical protein
VKKKKKKALVDVPPPPRSLYGVGSGNDNPEKALLEKLVTRADLVFIRLKQSDWQYSDFTVMVHATAPLYTLCRKIEEKHGRMASDSATGHTTLQLFRHPPNEKNLIPSSDWHLRLDQLGMTGGTVEEQHQAIIYYNYVPASYSALLQREPQLIVQSLSADDHDAYHDQQQARHGESDFLAAMEINVSAVQGVSLGGAGPSGSAKEPPLPVAAAASSSSPLSPRSAIGMASKATMQ